MQRKTNSPEKSTEEITNVAPKKAASSLEGQFDLFATPGTGSISDAEVATGFKNHKKYESFLSTYRVSTL
jgi:DNA polymerase-1